MWRLQNAGLLSAVRTELRPLVMKLRRAYFNKFWHMNIGDDCQISFSAKLDKTNPRGIYIGDSTAVSFRACILTHDYSRRMTVETRIGRQCQIGAYSLIMPGVTIGDNCVVAPASVVMKDIPANSLVAGNPARIMDKGIRTGRWGILIRDAPTPAQDPVVPAEANS